MGVFLGNGKKIFAFKSVKVLEIVLVHSADQGSAGKLPGAIDWLTKKRVHTTLIS